MFSSITSIPCWHLVVGITSTVRLDECIKDVNGALPSPGELMELITAVSGASCGIDLPVGETFILFISPVAFPPLTSQPFPITLCDTKAREREREREEKKNSVDDDEFFTVSVSI